MPRRFQHSVTLLTIPMELKAYERVRKRGKCELSLGVLHVWIRPVFPEPVSMGLVCANVVVSFRNTHLRSSLASSIPQKQRNRQIISGFMVIF